MLENKFQANLIKELKERFPGCIVMKMTRPTFREFQIYWFYTKTNGLP